jgi:hypothetical protein
MASLQRVRQDVRTAAEIAGAVAANILDELG